MYGQLEAGMLLERKLGNQMPMCPDAGQERGSGIQAGLQSTSGREPGVEKNAASRGLDRSSDCFGRTGQTWFKVIPDAHFLLPLSLVATFVRGLDEVGFGCRLPLFFCFCLHPSISGRYAKIKNRGPCLAIIMTLFKHSLVRHCVPQRPTSPTELCHLSPSLSSIQ